MADFKIGIILNPNSRKNRKSNCSAIAEFEAIGSGSVKVFATKDLAELDSVIKSLKKVKVPYIGISGGDGTIHHVLTHIINIYGGKNLPKILLLSDGTMNNIASSISLKGNTRSILKRFVSLIERGDEPLTVKRGTLKIDELYGSLFGFGLTSNVLNAIYKDGGKGFRRIASVIARLTWEMLQSPFRSSFDDFKILKYIDLDVKCDGKALPFKRILVSVGGSVEIVGVGFRTLYRCNEKDGHFHMQISGVKPLSILANIAKFKSGKRFSDPLHYDNVVKRMDVFSKKSFDYTLDGEMYSAKKITVEAGPVINYVIV